MNEHQPADELDLRAYFRPIWRRKFLIIAVTVIAGVATYFIARTLPKHYSSATQIYIQIADPTQLGVTSSQAPSTAQVSDVASLVTSAQVSGAVALQLKIPASEAVNNVVVAASQTSDVVTITGRAKSGAAAANLANAFATQYLNARKLSVIEAATNAQNAAKQVLSTLPSTSANVNDVAERATLISSIQNDEQTKLNPNPGAQQISKAVAPHFPNSPKPKQDAIFAAIAGLVLAVIAAFCLELLDRRLLSVSAVENIFGIPVVAVLPLITAPAPKTDGVPVLPPEFTEELRMLRLRLNAVADGEPPRRILVTSALPAEGKSTIARDIALMYAEAGDRVVLVDTDLRRPRQAQLFGIEAQIGLSHVLTREARLEEAIYAIDPADEHAGFSDALTPATVHVVPHGIRTDNPGLLLGSPGMARVIQQLAEEYDIVLIDTAPVLTVSDCVPLMELVDANLVVARLGETNRQTASRLVDLVEHLPHVKLDGIIANAVTGGLDEEGYGSYAKYGYGYYSDDKPARRPLIASPSSKRR